MVNIYSLTWLNEVIRLAKQLGFHDDVAHWEAEKKRLYPDAS